MKTKDWLAFTLLGVIWGSSFLWIKIAVRDINPVMLVAIRLLFGASGLALIAFLQRPQWPKQRNLWFVLILLGLTNNVIPYVLISWGEVYIDSAVASILNATTPLFTMVVAHIFLSDDRMSITRVAGVVCGFIGILILVSRDISAHPFSWENQLSINKIAAPAPIISGPYIILLGQLAVLLASLFYAGSSVFARRNTRGLSPIVQSIVPLAAGDTILWIFISQLDNTRQLPQYPITWLALIWLGFLGTGLAFLLYFYLLHSVGPTRMSMVTYIFPLVGVALGVIVLGENLDWQLLLGGGLIVGSILIVNRSPITLRTKSYYQ